MSWSIAVNESKVEKIQLGDFHLSCEPTTGTLQIAPANQTEEVPPTFIAKPVSLTLDNTKLSVVPEVGNTEILLSDFLNKLLNLPNIISLGGVEMSLRSFLGTVYARVVASEAVVADLSGVRIPAVLNEVVNNASLDAAREAAQLLKDQVQDASGALIALAAATAASDIAGLSGRVTALEAAPGFDATSINAAIATLQTDVAAKANASDLAAKADAADVIQFGVRVGSAEAAIAGHGTRLDAVEAGVASKVAQADYDMYVASNDAAVAALQGDVALKANASALADYALAANVDAKGVQTKLEVVEVSFVGLNSAYYPGMVANDVRPAVLAGKIASLAFGEAGNSFFLGLENPAAGAVARLRNSGAYAYTVNIGSAAAPAAAVEVAAGETATVFYNGTEWKMAF